METSVIPDLKKLGLEHLIPRLQEALIEEYNIDLFAPEIYQVKAEDMQPDSTAWSQEQSNDGKQPNNTALYGENMMEEK